MCKKFGTLKLRPLKSMWGKALTFDWLSLETQSPGRDSLSGEAFSHSATETLKTRYKSIPLQKLEKIYQFECKDNFFYIFLFSLFVLYNSVALVTNPAS